MDLVSIIIPVYNVERYISRCLDSIVYQSYQNIEIILIDDGSTDLSGKICNDYAKKDIRIKVMHKENAGLGYARNSGLEMAKGKFVTFIDSDDYVGVDHIKSMHDLIITTNTDTCIAGHTKVYATSLITHKNVCAGKVYRRDITSEILPRMCGGDSRGTDYIEMSVCMVLLSNKIIQENRLRFESERKLISEDLVFDFAYFPYSQGVCIGDMTDYYYCDNEDSLTTKYRKGRFENQVALYDEIMNRAVKLDIGKLCNPRLNSTLIAIARYSIKLEYKFSKINGIQKSRKNVKAICQNKTLLKVMDEFDDTRIKKSSRAVNLLIKNQNYILLELTMKFKNLFDI